MRAHAHVRACAVFLSLCVYIQDSDRVLVLDQGRVAEFDAPRALLARPNGALASMVADTGPQSAKFLRLIAERAVDIFGNILRPEAAAELAAAADPFDDAHAVPVTIHACVCVYCVCAPSP
jgi:ABC-type proline/glycine betaine transport system ATPase subunit